ncbi:MAG: hypothetical protein H6R45_1247 [Proteobacteria bacterium]|nr:hypothetical protein [Pseudomonadota bacterium]
MNSAWSREAQSAMLPRLISRRTWAVPVLPAILISPSWSRLLAPVPEPLTTRNMPSCVTASCSGVNCSGGPNGFGRPNMSEGTRFFPLAIRAVITASCSGETST